MDQLLEQLLAEITKLQHVKEDAQLHHQLHQMHVTVLQFQSKNVVTDQLQEQLLAEITQKHLANKNVLQLTHVTVMHKQ